MNFAVFGGDERAVRLVRLLRRDGHTVEPFALERALRCAASPAEAMAEADSIVLPLPCERGGLLFAPLSEREWCPGELLSFTRAGTPVCAGQVGEKTAAACRINALPLYDYFRRESFTLQNALLTAEGALALLLASPDALGGSRVLITGYGRIGSLLARRLRALGAEVTVAARSPAQRAAAECDGVRAMRLAGLGGEFDFVVNTAPAPVLGERELRALPGAALIELASPPYGIDAAAAERLGRKVQLASGLPGKTAPEAAAKAVRDAVYAILREER